MVGLRHQCYAKGQAIVLKSSRHRHCSIIEKVDKIGVVAQIRIEAHGILLHGLDGINRSRSGRQQTIDLRPYPVSFALEPAQLVCTLVGIRGGITPGAFDDLTHRCDHLVAVQLKKILDCRIPFGYPGAFIQQARSFEKRGQIYLGSCAAQGPHGRRRPTRTAVQYPDCQRIAADVGEAPQSGSGHRRLS